MVFVVSKGRVADSIKVAPVGEVRTPYKKLGTNHRPTYELSESAPVSHSEVGSN